MAGFDGNRMKAYEGCDGAEGPRKRDRKTRLGEPWMTYITVYRGLPGAVSLSYHPDFGLFWPQLSTLVVMGGGICRIQGFCTSRILIFSFSDPKKIHILILTIIFFGGRSG